MKTGQELAEAHASAQSEHGNMLRERVQRESQEIRQAHLRKGMPSHCSPGSGIPGASTANQEVGA